MRGHHVIIKTKQEIERAIHPQGMSVHDGKVTIPASHARWLVEEIERLEYDLECAYQAGQQVMRNEEAAQARLARYEGAVEIVGRVGGDIELYDTGILKIVERKLFPLIGQRVKVLVIPAEGEDNNEQRNTGEETCQIDSE